MAWWTVPAIIGGSAVANSLFGDDGGGRDVPDPGPHELEIIRQLMVLLQDNPYKTWDGAVAALNNGTLDIATPFGALVNYYTQLEEAKGLYKDLVGKYGAEADKYEGRLDEIAENLGVEKTDFKNTLGFLSAETKDVQGKIQASTDLFNKSMTALEKRSPEITEAYQKRIEEIEKTPGVKISFGGQEMGEMLPMNKMKMMAGLAESGYGAGMQDIATRAGLAESKLSGSRGGYQDILNAITQRGNLATTGYGKEENYAKMLQEMAGQAHGARSETLGAEGNYIDKLTQLAGAQYGPMSSWQMNPLMQLFNIFHPSRMGVSPGAQQTNWLDQILPLLTMYGMSQGGGEDKDPYQGWNLY